MIAPALTAEEWNEGDHRDGSYVSFARGVVDCRDSAFDGEFAPALMALANDSLPDDSPYKITFEDWSDLKSAMSNMETLASQLEDRPDLAGSAYPGAVRRRANTLKSLADKIAAILPPMTT